MERLRTAFEASRGVRVMLNAAPPVTLAGAVTRKCVAVGLRLVSAKVVVKALMVAVTLYGPAIPFAEKTGGVATPLPSVAIVAVVLPPANVPEAPLAGAVNVTFTEGIVAFEPSFTVAAS